MAYAAWQATSSMPTPLTPCPAGTYTYGSPACTGPSPTADEQFFRELLGILNETRSQDAFLVTLSILQELKADPYRAVPVIIRNAERLKLFGRTSPDHISEQQRMVAECIAALINKESVPTADSAPGPISGAALGAGIGALAGSLTGSAIGSYATPAGCLADLPMGGTKPPTEDLVPGTVKSRSSGSGFTFEIVPNPLPVTPRIPGASGGIFQMTGPR
jgi:hypothetical protein